MKKSKQRYYTRDPISSDNCSVTCRIFWTSHRRKGQSPLLVVILGDSAKWRITVSNWRYSYRQIFTQKGYFVLLYDMCFLSISLIPILLHLFILFYFLCQIWIRCTCDIQIYVWTPLLYLFIFFFSDAHLKKNNNNRRIRNYLDFSVSLPSKVFFDYHCCATLCIVEKCLRAVGPS